MGGGRKLNKDHALLLLLTNLFIAFLGIGLVIPVLPTLMNELHISGSTVGYMVATFAIAQLLFSPIAGRWVDAFGRKRILVIGLFLFSLSELLFGIGTVVETLFVSRFLGGLSAAFIMPAVTAFIADITTVENRAKALGYMSASISTGFIIGPGIGGFLAELGHRVPFFFAAGLALIATIFSIVVLKEPTRQKVEDIVGEEMTGFRRIFTPKFFVPFMVIFVSTVGLVAFEATFSLYMDHKFQFTPRDIAIVITGGAIVGAIAQVALFDKLTRRFGEIRVTRVSFLISAFFAYCMTIVHDYWMIVLVTVFIFVGFDLIRPAVTSYLSKIAANEQGFVGGMNSMFTSVGNIIGPIIGGALFDINLDYPYLFSVVVLMIGYILCFFWITKVPTTTKAGSSH